MPTLNVTLTNIEAHPRTAKTDPETTYRTKNRAADANRNSELHSQKIFSALILALFQPNCEKQKSPVNIDHYF
jgi:hypothetical protein